MATDVQSNLFAFRVLPFEWQEIPEQCVLRGIPFSLDLNDYLPMGSGATITLKSGTTLPPGLNLSNGVVSGTLTAVLADIYARPVFIATLGRSIEQEVTMATFESGVWTPTVSNLGSGESVDDFQGTYQQIGEIVSYEGQFRLSKTSDWDMIDLQLTPPTGTSIANVSGKADGQAGVGVKLLEQQRRVSSYQPVAEGTHIFTSGRNLEGLAFVNDVAYVLVRGSSSHYLHEMDFSVQPSTRTQVGVTNLGLASTSQAWRLGSDGTNLWVFANDRRLTRVNPSTGATTQIGSIDGESYSDVAYFQGEMYGAFSSTIYRINLTDGTRESIVTVGSMQSLAGGVEIGGEEVLVGVDNQDRLVQIDLMLGVLISVSLGDTFWNFPSAVLDNDVYSFQGATGGQFRRAVAVDFKPELEFGDDDYTTGKGYCDEVSNRIRVNFSKVTEDGNDSLVHVQGSYRKIA